MVIRYGHVSIVLLGRVRSGENGNYYTRDPSPHIVLLLVRAPFLPISGNIWWFTQPVAGVLVILGGKRERAVATSVEFRGQRKVDFFFSSVLLRHWLVGRCGYSLLLTPLGDMERCSGSMCNIVN